MTSWTSHEHSLIQRLELLTARGANSRRLAGTPELCPEHNPGERRTPRTLTVRPRMSSSSHTQMTTSDIVSSDAETDQQTTPRWRREIRISTSWSFWFSRTRLEERLRQEKIKQLVCKTESCREVKVNSCGYSCVAQVCPNTASFWHLDRTAGVSRPPTHTHLCFTACALACRHAYAGPGCTTIIICVYTSVYKHTMGALSDRHAPAMRTMQKRSRARRKTVWQTGQRTKGTWLQQLIKPLKLWMSLDFPNIPGLIHNFRKEKVSGPVFIQLPRITISGISKACAPCFLAPDDLK